ncbi:hypothetical protein ZIOFF_006636 [Zingiber officinale]|uniref:WEB family protein n=1 Tax=Zingiber officinale TaxID=94328 RepID=A0A8J5M587_ZINOF|nr:hypothetical protein ZIOFF_006636 [Zingiber officinale]
MMPSRAKSGWSTNSNMNSQGVLKGSRFNRNGSAPERHSLPPSKPRVSVDRQTKSVESKASSKNSTNPNLSMKSELQEKLEAVERELKQTRGELSETKRLADEMNEELEKATVARARAEEILDTEKFRMVELEEELHEELENLQSRHEQDVSSLNSLASELQLTKGELRDARREKELACHEAEGAKRAAKLYEEKAMLMSKELGDLKALHESELASVGKEAEEKVGKSEAETVMLKLELERERIAEEKLVHMELLIEKLQIEATDARNEQSDVCALVDEWRNKAGRLKADLEEAYQSEKSASDSLADMMVKLEETKSLFEDAKREISILDARIDSMEIEAGRQRIDLEESNRQLDLAQQDALNIGKTVELLKLELKRLEEEKSVAVTGEKVAALRIESLSDELNISKDEGEKTRKAMECLALKVQSMSIEDGEKDERLARMQSEIEESHKEIDHLSRVLRNTEERYEVMLDEARYELVCLQNRCKGEAKELRSSEWDAKEKNFVDTIRELEGLVELHEIAKHEKNELQQIESRANSSPDEEEQSKNEDLLPNETLLEEENGLESGEQCSKELETLENTEKDCEVSNTKMEWAKENGSSEIPFKEQEDHFQEDPIEDSESKMNCESGNRMNGTEQQKLQRRRKKKALLYNFGNLLKGNH